VRHDRIYLIPSGTARTGRPSMLLGKRRLACRSQLESPFPGGLEPWIGVFSAAPSGVCFRVSLPLACLAVVYGIEVLQGLGGLSYATGASSPSSLVEAAVRLELAPCPEIGDSTCSQKELSRLPCVSRVRQEVFQAVWCMSPVPYCVAQVIVCRAVD
jgi:hypothetical protein